MSDFGLYLTDVNGENFAVDHSGRVTVVDLENIVVVDKLAIQASKKINLLNTSIMYYTIIIFVYKLQQKQNQSLVGKVNLNIIRNRYM